ncbi:MAG TPA: cyclopropane-fatty-acyl-phospholipid synthase family protein [Rhizomicrobium sp.]
MRLIPQSIIQDRWFKTLQRMKRGRIVFVAPNGEARTFGGHCDGPTAFFRIHEWSVLERAAARGDIGLGEDYIDGAWETPDIEALIAFFLANIEELDGFADGNFINRLLFRIRNGLVRRNSLSGSRRNIHAHYDMGNEFFALWLDETMTYSSALFGGAACSLSEAQQRKYRRILSRLDPGKQSILEIGCGWGGFAEQAVQDEHRVTGLTISPAQYAFASQRLGSNAEIQLEDYRHSRGKFDAVVSIEMVEAVGERYWPIYFHTLAERLKQGGRAIIQSIVIRDELFSAYRTRSDFVRHYVFPGGMLPSIARLKQEAESAGLRFLNTFSFGQDYASTLRIWNARMREREGEIRGMGHDDGFIRTWQFYLGMCAAAFAVDRTSVAQLEFVRT